MNYMMNMKPVLILSLAMTLLQCNPENEVKPLTLFVGTYTDAESEGIYKLQFDSENGKILSSNLAAKITSPSYLAISQGKALLVRFILKHVLRVIHFILGKLVNF
jgi:6-phosphogluconolactonase